MEKNDSNKSFGILFFYCFFNNSYLAVFTSESVRVWAIILSLIFLVLGIINSKLLTPFKKIWIKLGEILGKFIAPIVMGFIYFLIITPIGLFMRLIKKDLLSIKFHKENLIGLRGLKILIL